METNKTNLRNTNNNALVYTTHFIIETQPETPQLIRLKRLGDWLTGKAEAVKSWNRNHSKS